MNIVDFELSHVAEAVFIAQMQMERECAAVELSACYVTELSGLVNDMGVAALKNGRLVGHLCAYGPFAGMFGTMHTPYADQFVGVFSPLEAHGVATDAPARTWQRMLQAAARKWAKAGAYYHSISLYEHDLPAKAALFRYSFGQRCVDAIRRAEPLDWPAGPGVQCSELPPGCTETVRELRWKLDDHLCQSPCFMARTEEGRKGVIQGCLRSWPAVRPLPSLRCATKEKTSSQHVRACSTSVVRTAGRNTAAWRQSDAAGSCAQNPSK